MIPVESNLPGLDCFNISGRYFAGATWLRHPRVCHASTHEPRRSDPAARWLVPYDVLVGSDSFPRPGYACLTVQGGDRPCANANCGLTTSFCLTFATSFQTHIEILGGSQYRTPRPFRLVDSSSRVAVVLVDRLLNS